MSKKYMPVLLIFQIFIVLLLAPLSLCNVNPADYTQGYESDSDAVTALLNELSQNRPGITSNQAIWTQWGLAWLDIYRGQLQSAQSKLTQLKTDYADNPELATALYWLGNAYWATDQHSQACQLYQDVIDTNSTSYEALHANKNLALLDINMAKYENANNTLTTMLSTYTEEPELPQVVYWIANEFFKAGQRKQAIQAYQKVIEIQPQSDFAFKANKNLALLDINMAKYENANNILTAMLSTYAEKPELPQAVYWIANEFFKAGQTEHSIQAYQKVIEIQPQSDFAFKANKNIVKIQIKQGQLFDANEAYQRFITDFPDSNQLPEAVMGIGNEFYWNKYYGSAQIVFENLLSHWPDDYYAMFAARSLLAIELQNGNYEVANSSIPQFLSRYSSHKEMHKAYVWLMEDYYNEAAKKQDAAAAEILLQKALELGQLRQQTYPDINDPYIDPAFHRCLGDSCRALGQYTEAITSYRQLITKYPHYELAWHIQFQIGQCLEKMKEEGRISPEQANSKIRIVYEKLTADYPNCKAVPAAQSWLDNN